METSLIIQQLIVLGVFAFSAAFAYVFRGLYPYLSFLSLTGFFAFRALAAFTGLTYDAFHLSVIKYADRAVECVSVLFLLNFCREFFIRRTPTRAPSITRFVAVFAVLVAVCAVFRYTLYATFAVPAMYGLAAFVWANLFKNNRKNVHYLCAAILFAVCAAMAIVRPLGWDRTPLTATVAVMIFVNLYAWVSGTVMRRDDKRGSRLLFGVMSRLAVTLFVALALGVMGLRFAESRARRVIMTESKDYLAAVSNRMLLRLSHIDDFAKLFAGEGELRAILADVAVKRDKAYDVLYAYARETRSSMCFVTDASGTVRVSTNRMTPDSLEGRSVADQEYFVHASEGQAYGGFGLGKFTGERGYFSSAPVYGDDDRLLGVVVIKKNISFFEKFSDFKKNVFLVSPHGIVFVASDERYRLRPLWPVSSETERFLKEGGYEGLLPIPVLSHAVKHGETVVLDGEKFLFTRFFGVKAGWSFCMLNDTTQMKLYRYGAALAILLAVLCITVFAVFYYLGKMNDLMERASYSEALARDSEKRVRKIIESLPLTVFDADSNGTFVFANASFFREFHWTKADLRHATLESIATEDDRIKAREYHAQVLGGEPAAYEFTAVRKDHSKFSALMRAVAIEKDGKASGVRGIILDISDRKAAEDAVRASLEQKEVLLKEIHHRVKNNLQIISSIINLQSQFVKDAASLAVLKDSQHRIRSIALVHEKLYRSFDFEKIDLRVYCEQLCRELMGSYALSMGHVQLVYDVDEYFIEIEKAIPCGLILNELVSNAFKHAFAHGRAGVLTVGFRKNAQSPSVLWVHDSVGALPADYDPHKAASLGSQLITTLAHQLGAKLEIDRAGGTAFRLLIPLKDAGV
jgi:PAS domain S-box-containing protein